MKQITECLDRAFQYKKPLKKKWKAVIETLSIDSKQYRCLLLFHYHHLILAYDLEKGYVIYQWWETQTDKRGLNATIQYLKNKNEVSV